MSDKIREALEGADYLLMCVAENLRVAGRDARTVEAGFNMASKIDKLRPILAALASEGQESGEPVEQVARMIARGLGHNDETGMHWERYVLPARIIVREFRATPPQESAALPQSTQEGISHSDLCKLSRIFNLSGLWNEQDWRINEWLKSMIAVSSHSQEQE